MAEIPARVPHILLPDSARAEAYSSGPRPQRRQLPRRDRKLHAQKLQSDLTEARESAEARRTELADRLPVGVALKRGTHLEFIAEPGFDLDLNGMERRPAGIELVNVRQTEAGGRKETSATVFVPDQQLTLFKDKVQEYSTKNTPEKKLPKHQKWAAPIAGIRRAELLDFWMGDADDLPPRPDQAAWFEVWLRGGDEKTLDGFRALADTLGLRVSERSLTFPDRRVVLVYGSLDQLALSIEVVDSIAELRRPPVIPSFFVDLSAQEMRDWEDDLLDRLQPVEREDSAVCLLDTGVNRGHGLITPFLEEQDLHSVDEGWGREDHVGHGTEMAGIALYEDLASTLAGSGPVEIPFVLESVKILPRTGNTDPELWGAVTEQAVARVEIERPERRRCHLMPVSATDTRDRGRPSSWSGAVDKIAAGVDENEQRRLMIVAAGNERDREIWRSYPDHLDSAEIHDPGQAWNALTVGACTDRHQIDEADFEGWGPLAPPGDLSAVSSTSVVWDDAWPIKPDIVLEGGNAARDATGQVDTPDSLGLLTTYYRPGDRPFTITRDTSAASAQAARMAGWIQASYPEYWPETVRALLVHSARWTGQMQTRFGPLDRKSDVRRLVRSCGFGSPSLERALWSAGNHLTLVVQGAVRPFTKTKGGVRKSSPQLNEMHFHSLPWPREQLEALGEVEVRLRVTLSYFVEPSPGERGWQTRYRYASHGLRFDVRGAQETEEDFRMRLNVAARAEDEGSPGGGDHSGWMLGPTLRHRGSLHSDVWTGTAAELATREQIGVYPIGGWWKERAHLGRWNRTARYALLVSIEAPEVEVDLYTPVAAQIGVPIEITT
jgi:hypothetical protein